LAAAITHGFVEIVGQRHIDSVDIRVFQQVLVAFVTLEDLKLLGPGPRRGRISTRQCDQPAGSRHLDPWDQPEPADPGAAKNSPSQAHGLSLDGGVAIRHAAYPRMRRPSRVSVGVGRHPRCVFGMGTGVTPPVWSPENRPAQLSPRLNRRS